MLFAQVAIALAACESFLRTPALAVASAESHAEKPCHQEGGASGNANLCLAHCLAGDQSIDKPGVSVPPLATAFVLALRPIDRLLPETVVRRRLAVHPAAGPPPRILFRSLLI